MRPHSGRAVGSAGPLGPLRNVPLDEFGPYDTCCQDSAESSSNPTGSFPGPDYGNPQPLMASDVGLVSGEYYQDHQVVPYQSQGVLNGIDLQYSSLQANPLPVVTAGLKTGIGSNSAHITSINVQLTLNGVSQGSMITYNGVSLTDGSTFLATYQANATSLATGLYSATETITKNFDNMGPQVEGFTGTVKVVNAISSPYGAGWSIGGLQAMWSVSSTVAMITNGTDAAEEFTSSDGTHYMGDMGDTSTLTHNTGGTWTRAYPDGTSVTFNSSGQETSIADRNGNTTSYAYLTSGPATGALQTITDPVGLRTTLAYNASGRLSTITDPAARVTTIVVDSNGNLTSATDPDNAVTAYGYSTPSNHRMTTETNPNSKTATVTYDSLGRFSSETLFDGTSSVSTGNAQETGLVAPGGTTPLKRPSNYQGTVTDPNGHAPTLTFDNMGHSTNIVDAAGKMTTIVRNMDGWPTTVTDPLSHTTSYAYDSRGNITQITRPDGTSMSTQYDATFSQPTRITDFNGNITTYTLDSHGNTTRRTDPDLLHEDFTYNSAGQVLTDTDRNGHTTTYAYGGVGRLSTITYSGTGSPTTKISYNSAGNAISVTDESGDRTTYTYDNDNRVKTSQNPIQAAAGQATTNGYDAAGNLTSITDANGHTTSYMYDARNRVTTIIDAVNQGAGKQTTYGYDARGNVTDPLGHRTTYAYDNDNRRTGMTDALGDHTTWTYDSAGELKVVTDPNGHATSYVHDQDGRVQNMVEPTQSGGLATYTYSYDNDNNLKTVTDPLGHATSYSYDSLNRLTTMVVDANSGGGTHLITSTYGYDAAGNQTTATDGLGHTTTSAYDQRNRLVSVTEPSGGGTTSYTYDNHSRLTSIKDPDSNITSYLYNSADRVTTVTDPLSHNTTYSYDLVNNVTGKTDRNGRIYQYGYDADNRETTEKWIPVGGGAAFNTITTTYDAAGRVTQMQDATSKDAYTYDNANRLLTVNDSGTTGLPQVTLTYGYDPAGNRTSLDDTKGGRTSYVYDARNELVTLTQSGTGVAAKRVDLSYDAAGRMTTLTRDSNLAGTTIVLRSVYGYDNADRLVTLTHKTSGGTVRVSYADTLDNAGRLTQEVRTWASGASTDTVTYGYTSNDQLTSVSHTHVSFANESFSYDANGNRTGTTGTDNRLTTDGTYNYAYDNEGNLLTRHQDL